MYTLRAVCAVLLLQCAIVSAAEITPVKGEPIKGDIISVSDKDVVYKVGDKTVTRPVKEILKIDYRDVARPAAGASYSMVELTDGSQLFTTKLLLKKKELELVLLSGQTIKLPVSVVASILNDAQVEANRRDGSRGVFKSRGKEAIVRIRDKTVSTLECTLGEGDETGTSIHVAAVIGSETVSANRKIAELRGIIFKNVLDSKASPVTCKLLDTMQGVVMVSTVSVKDGALSVTTPAGAKIELKDAQVARLDYTKGRLEYLSDLEPIKVVEKSNLSDGDEKDKWYVYKDSNIDKNPLVVGGSKYAKGLALVPRVELTYDLRGDYREFEAVVGFDRGVPANGGVILTIEGDGKELSRTVVSSKDKSNFQNVLLNVKDVQKLAIVLESDSLFDTSRHLNLADAKVRKE